MRRVVSVYLPTWPTDRIRRKDPAAPPHDKPLVTVSQIGGACVIASVCEAARAAGLYPGMPLAQAHAFIGGLAVAEADRHGDTAGLRQLALWAVKHWSPIAAPDPPDGFLIDITGCDHLFGGEAAMLARIISKLEKTGLAARAAVASTVGAAHAVARFGSKELVMTIEPGRTVEALAPLPVAALRLVPEIARELHRFGFRRIGQLLGEPRAPLTLRFGSGLCRRLDQALGHAFEAIAPVFPQAAPRRRLTFTEPVGSAETLSGAADRLTRSLCAVMEEQGIGARQLDLFFERVDRSMIGLRVGTARPSRNPVHLARLLTRRLEEIDPGFGIEAMMLAAPWTEPLEARQTAITDLADSGMDTNLAMLVDRLAALPQVARLYAAAPVESDVPERTVHRIKPLDASASLAWPSCSRPFWLFQPEPVHITAALPDGPPAQFVWRGRVHRIRCLDGPERLHLEWWRQPSEILGLRDYYRVEDETGGRFWLYRDARDNAGASWFIHGVFA